MQRNPRSEADASTSTQELLRTSATGDRRRRSNLTLRKQLVGLSAAVAVVVALMLVTITSFVVSKVDRRAVDDELRARAGDLTAATRAATTGPTLEVPADRLVPGAVVYDDRGTAVAGHAASALASTFNSLSTVAHRTRVTADDYGFLAVPVRSATGANGVVVVAEPLAPYRATERRVLIAALVAGVTLVCLSTLTAVAVTRRALRPVAQMARTAAEWSEHDLQRRFDLGPPHDELTLLAQALDGLLDKVAGAISSEQRLTSELAHELRSPLTAIQLSADLTAMRPGLDDEVARDVEQVQAACAAMMSTMTALLELARHTALDTGIEPCRLRAMVADLATVLPDGERLDVDVRDDIAIGVPQQLAVRVIAPVIENALRAAEHVSVTARVDPDLVRLDVVDDGPGVPADARGSLFTPGTSQAGGTGLGLALARRIARSFGGDVRYVPPGSAVTASGSERSLARRFSGARFVIEFPRGDG